VRARSSLARIFSFSLILLIISSVGFVYATNHVSNERFTLNIAILILLVIVNMSLLVFGLAKSVHLKSWQWTIVFALGIGYVMFGSFFSWFAINLAQAFSGWQF